MLSAGREVCLGRPQNGGTHTVSWTGTHGCRSRGLPSFVSIFTFVLLLILPLQGSAWPHGKTQSLSTSLSLPPLLSFYLSLSPILSFHLSLSPLSLSPPTVSLGSPQHRWLNQLSGGGLEKRIPSDKRDGRAANRSRNALGTEE